MQLVHFIRHCMTRQEPSIPAEQWGLSDDGLIAAAALAGNPLWTSVQQVLTSNEIKTLATVTPALELWGLPQQADGAFDEVRRVGYSSQAEYTARVERLFTHPDESEDGWETATHAIARGMAGLERAITTFPTDNIAIVGHGLLWSLLRAHLLGKPQVDLAEWRAVRFPDIATWQVEAGRWTLMQDFEGIRGLGIEN